MEGGRMKIYHKNGIIKKIEFCCDEMSNEATMREMWIKEKDNEDEYYCCVYDSFTDLAYSHNNKCFFCNAKIEIIEEDV